MLCPNFILESISKPMDWGNKKSSGGTHMASEPLDSRGKHRFIIPNTTIIL